MRKSFSVKFLAVFLVVSLTACQTSGQQSNLEEAEVQELSASKEGIQIKTEKATYTSKTDEIVIVITNNSKEELNGTSFELEKKVEELWYKFPVKESGPLDAVGGYQPPNSKSNIVFSTDELKHDLSPGSYRATFAGMAADFKVIE